VSVNRHKPHVYVIPEDDANRQLANGFIGHDQVLARAVQVMPPAGGWKSVLKKFADEYLPVLTANPGCHVVLLIDFDGQFPGRMAEFAAAIPQNLKGRVFVIGSEVTPELLRQALGLTYERIGNTLAEDCHGRTTTLWSHPQLVHNLPECQQMSNSVRGILFTP
jgi:hypothetical protein